MEGVTVTFCILVMAKKISIDALSLPLFSDDGKGKALKDFLKKRRHFRFTVIGCV